MDGQRPVTERCQRKLPSVAELEAIQQAEMIDGLEILMRLFGIDHSDSHRMAFDDEIDAELSEWDKILHS